MTDVSESVVFADVALIAATAAATPATETVAFNCALWILISCFFLSFSCLDLLPFGFTVGLFLYNNCRIFDSGEGGAVKMVM